MRALAYVLSFILNIMLYSGASKVGGLGFWETFALLAVLNFIAILLHELGHAWAFLHVGGSVDKIVVMFLAYDARKRRLSFSNRLIGKDIGGYVAGRYATDRPTPRQVILVSAAGPLANLASGALVLLATLLLSVAFQAPPSLPSQAAIAGTPALSESLAALPSQDVMDKVASEVDRRGRYRVFRDLSHTAIVLFITLSVGLAFLNLLPFGGSDGQSILRAIRQWRLMAGRLR